MERHQNFARYFFISAGLIIFLYCALAPFNAIDKQIRRYYKSQAEWHGEKAKSDFLLTEYNSLKKEIEDLNNIVDQEANEISSLIFEAGALGDSILQIMNDPESISNLADSLTVLDETIRHNERLVDSLNQEFEANSDMLIAMMEKYNKRDEEIKLRTFKVEGMEKSVFASKIIVFTNIVLSILLFLLGVVLLVKGLAMKNQ